MRLAIENDDELTEEQTDDCFLRNFVRLLDGSQDDLDGVDRWSTIVYCCKRRRE